jgi:predicted metal-dependent enzyme (double-stranded beta helix superfamily)
MFDRDRFIEECRAARAADPSHKAVREVVARAVNDPAALMASLGEPSRAGIFPLYRGEDLTILNLVWGPKMTIMPHDHNTWAVIGLYTGAEDNLFWRRLPDGRLEAAGAQALRVRDCAPLGRDIVHSVTNPLEKLTGAIHVYSGDFFTIERSEWDPETLTEGRYDVEKARRMFDDSNRMLAP